MEKRPRRLYIAQVLLLRSGLRQTAVLVGLVAAISSPVRAEELTCAEGIVIDMPSGFVPGEGDGQRKFSYLSPNGEIEFDILIQNPGRYLRVEEFAAAMLAKLGSQGDRSSFTYEGRTSVIAELNFPLSATPRRGYGLFIKAAAGSEYALVAHTAASRFEAAADFIFSCLDAFSIDRAARRSPGPVSQFLLAWPVSRAGKKPVMLPTGRSELPWSAEEAAQELATVQREYRILKTYLSSKTHWKDAWARFYRMVYRESAGRLDRFTEVFTGLLPRENPTESARRVLAWIQDFTFERDLLGIDLVPPLVAAFERRGDCDSRALVMAMILERLGIDCILMLSREYSHAMLAVAVPGGGQRFPFNGREYLVAETTSKVGLGMIDSSQTDFSKWLGVDVGD
jgi:hypothetical protein